MVDDLHIVLGKVDEITVAEAREKAAAAIAEARAERETGPLFADFARDFMRRQGRRWKPSTRKGNAHLIDRYLGRFVFPNKRGDGRMTDLGLRWQKLRNLAELDGVRIHDFRNRNKRHTWASQGVMNGVGLSTVGRLLGHRQRETTAIYAHLDDGALRDAAAQAATVIAHAMGHKPEAPPLRDEAGHGEVLTAVPECSIAEGPSAVPGGKRTLLWVRSRETERTDGTGSASTPQPPPGRPALDWL